MFRLLRTDALQSRRRSILRNVLVALPLTAWDDTVSIPPLLTRCFGAKKRKPAKRSQYALRRKEEIVGYKKSPFGLEGRPVKQFDELKFYHARNKHGQKQTLVDGRRRDIAFFDPVKGGYDRWILTRMIFLIHLKTLWCD